MKRSSLCSIERSARPHLPHRQSQTLGDQLVALGLGRLAELAREDVTLAVGEHGGKLEKDLLVFLAYDDILRGVSTIGDGDVGDVDAPPTGAHRLSPAFVDTTDAVSRGRPERPLDLFRVGERPRVLGRHEGDRLVDDRLELVARQAVRAPIASR